MRRDHPAFRLRSAAEIAANIHFEEAPTGCIVYLLDGAAVHDSWNKIWIAFNGTGGAQKLRVPSGFRGDLISGADEMLPTGDGTVILPGFSAAIFHR
jgi:pullulanase